MTEEPPMMADYIRHMYDIDINNLTLTDITVKKSRLYLTEEITLTFVPKDCSKVENVQRYTHANWRAACGEWEKEMKKE